MKGADIRTVALERDSLVPVLAPVRFAKRRGLVRLCALVLRM